jgi:hypothetical protein
VALLVYVAGADGSFASRVLQGSDSAPVGTYPPDECTSPRWNDESGEILSKL